MIKSMTGFGQAVYDDGQVQITVEIKTLNSKFLDINLRISRSFSDKEIEVRNFLSDQLERGKVSLSIDYVRVGQQEPKQTYNEVLFTAYYSELKKLADKVKAPYDNIFSLAINSPEVIQGKTGNGATPEEWNAVKSVYVQAISKCNEFRDSEGKVLASKLNEYIHVIQSGLIEIAKLDPGRIQRIRDRLKGNIKASFGEEGYDENRLEQEIIFYAEKLDISEEKVRLGTHLDYFISVMDSPSSSGKKLSFISQEIGREINTIGSKAGDAEIQKHVVMMKEELEKIKEQLANVL
jgi:uncharacterized protein (TIGR00255 family)